MRVIQPEVHIVECDKPYMKAELAGRVCYKSEANITPDSAKAFVQRAIDRGHFAVLEHETVTFGLDNSEVAQNSIRELLHLPFVRHSEYCVDVMEGKYLNVFTVSLSHLYKPENSDKYWLIGAFKKLFENWVNGSSTGEDSILVANSDVDLYIIHDVAEFANHLSTDFSFDGEEFWNLHGTYTFHFTCDRGVSHELVRHRCAISQESTRYCNYGKEKFGNQLTYIKPSTWDEWPVEAQEEWTHQMQQDESAYLALLSYGLTPQQARSVMPNSLKTEVIMTMPVWQWEHFFNLRSAGTTGAPHPDMKQVADAAYIIFMEKEIDRQV